MAGFGVLVATAAIWGVLLVLVWCGCGGVCGSVGLLSCCVLWVCAMVFRILGVLSVMWCIVVQLGGLGLWWLVWFLAGCACFVGFARFGFLVCSWFGLFLLGWFVCLRCFLGRWGVGGW